MAKGKTEVIHIRVTEEARKMIKRAAKLSGRKVSDWGARHLEEVAEGELSVAAARGVVQ